MRGKIPGSHICIDHAFGANGLRIGRRFREGGVILQEEEGVWEYLPAPYSLASA